jgi:hypothetical protein
MVYQPPPTEPTENSIDLDFTDCGLNETRIELQPKDWQQAVRLSQSINQPEQRWQVYLCALGVFGFKQWLKERGFNSNQVNIHKSSIWQPAYANLVAAACNIEVDNFKVCLITANKLTNQHSFPFAILDIPELTAHFYVLMQVDEEQNQVAVSGFINYEQYCHYQTIANQQIESDWTYTLPENLFNADANTLLLNLRCLDKDAIQLPINLTTTKTEKLALQKKLETIKPQLKTKQIWELLTPAEGQILLNYPELINWVYEASSPSLMQPLINVKLWLNNHIDTVAQELGWMLMPSVASSQMRDLNEGFDTIRSSLEAKGIHIPITASGAFRNLDSDCCSLRLYTIIWLLDQTSDQTSDIQEWMLLITLGSQPQIPMPKNIKLEICDDTQTIFSDFLADTSQRILYAQVIGTISESFQITVTAEDTVFEIPPFGMNWE